MKELIVFDEMDAPSADGTSLKGGVMASYNQLVNALGEPTFSEPSADGKVNVEWIVRYDDEIFTVYDWKNYENNPADNPDKVINWHIGGHRSAFDFMEELENRI